MALHFVQSLLLLSALALLASTALGAVVPRASSSSARGATADELVAARDARDAADDAALLPAALAPATPLDVDDLAVVEAAHWAVNHLRGLSDSGAYEALRLRAVRGAAAQRGVLHALLHLQLELAAPPGLLASGADSSRHAVTVLTDDADGVRSFAIDAFPLLAPGAVEAAWARKADAAAARREREFARLEGGWDAWTAAGGARAACEGAGRSEDSTACQAARAAAAAALRWPSEEEIAAAAAGRVAGAGAGVGAGAGAGEGAGAGAGLRAGSEL